MDPVNGIPYSHELLSDHLAWGDRPVCLEQLNFLPKGAEGQRRILLNLVDGNVGKHQILLKLKWASSGSSAQSEALLNKTQEQRNVLMC